MKRPFPLLKVDLSLKLRSLPLAPHQDCPLSLPAPSIVPLQGCTTVSMNSAEQPNKKNTEDKTLQKPLGAVQPQGGAAHGQELHSPRGLMPALAGRLLWVPYLGSTAGSAQPRGSWVH